MGMEKRERSETSCVCERARDWIKKRERVCLKVMENGEKGEKKRHIVWMWWRERAW